MFKGGNVTVIPPALTVPAGKDSFTFRLNITGLKFFEFRFSMNLAVIDVNHFDSLDLKDFFRSIPSDVPDQPTPSLLDSPDFLAVKNYFLKKMSSFSKDPFFKNKPIESLSFIFLINEQSAPFRLESLRTSPNPPLNRPSLAPILKSLDNLRESKLSRFYTPFAAFEIKDRFQLVLTQPAEVCLVLVPAIFARNFLLKRIILDVYQRYCRPEVDHVGPFNYTVETSHPSIRVVKKASDSHKDQFQVKLSFGEVGFRQEAALAFVTTQHREPFFLKALFRRNTHRPAQFFPSACCISSHLEADSLTNHLGQRMGGLRRVEETPCVYKHTRPPLIPATDNKGVKKTFLVFGNATFLGSLERDWKADLKKEQVCHEGSTLLTLAFLKPKLKLAGVRGDGIDFQLSVDSTELRLRRFMSVRFSVVVKNLSGHRLFKLILLKPKRKRNFFARFYEWNQSGFRSFEQRWRRKKLLVPLAASTLKSTRTLAFSINGMTKYHFYRFDSFGCLADGEWGVSECGGVPANQREVSTDDFQYKIRRIGGAGAMIGWLLSLVLLTSIG
jgi:hypothetical protein